ncbi:Uncharacterised protein [BD1-7 clade bacterium]|uniref:ATPase n=1 Tax=BD1-7 clade bacterium TaxID=2029982 RepID=A0A5S9P6W7_9GAMM|nr:Uncharacterised protein [BD1-7 clade bacterium]CAA0099195.1 Uncharacterised protein [BD1-7 clade bacterium]
MRNALTRLLPNSASDPQTNTSQTSLRKLFVVSAATLILSACSGGSGGGGSDREPDPTDGDGDSGFVYQGPPPADTNIQAFKTAFFDNLVAPERCGACHTRGGTGPIHFADNTDVNYAWQQAQQVANLLDPSNSAVVSRAAGGHNCWLGAAQAATCATTITGYIEQWAQGLNEGSTSDVKLTPRSPYEPAASLLFPATSAGFSPIHNLLVTHCADCHAPDAAFAQTPFFAAADINTAYAAAQSKINLSNPSDSRFVVRLASEFHNCWDTGGGVNCPQSAIAMESVIAAYSSTLEQPDEVDPNLVISTAQILESDGIIATAGGRFEDNIIAKWEFREGRGTTVADTSGIQPEMPLTLTGEYQWLGGWGVRFINGRAQASAANSKKLFDKIAGGGEYSIEMWVTPYNVTQENAWIAAYAGSRNSRNFMINQHQYNYVFSNRNQQTDATGDPVSTDDDAELAQASQQHLVVTYSPVNGRRIYVNATEATIDDETDADLLANWDASFAFMLGNTISNTRPWAGNVRMAAIHNRELSTTQISQNFSVGVGQKYFLLFSIAEILDRPGECHTSLDDAERTRINYCYVVFEASQFDSYSYLFDSPFFVNLNPDSDQVKSVDIRGMRLGINGKLVGTGQAWNNIDTTVGDDNYTASGQPMSDIGSIIGMEISASQDMFFLAFDEMDGKTSVTTPPTFGSFNYNLQNVQQPALAIRTFDKINFTFSQITGIPTTQSQVADTFARVRESLPQVADFGAYFSSHQMAVTQLAIAYCDALVKDSGARTSFFTGSATPIFGNGTAVAANTITDQQWLDHIIIPLTQKTLNTELESQPSRPPSIDGLPDQSTLRNELLTLITTTEDRQPYVWDPQADGGAGAYVSDGDGNPDGLARCNGSCPTNPNRTEEVVKAVCAAVLGSGALMIQ